MKLDVTLTARNDLDDIWDYISVRGSAGSADKILQGIDEIFALLLTHPGLGQSRDGLGPGLRGIPKGNHIVFYRVWPQRLEIVRVIDGRRDLKKLF